MATHERTGWLHRLYPRPILNLLADLLATPQRVCFDLPHEVYWKLWEQAFQQGLRMAWDEGLQEVRMSADFWVCPHDKYHPSGDAWVIPRNDVAELWLMMNTPEVPCKL